MNHPALVKVAIWPKGHDAMSFEIRLLTRGYGSHAAFIRENGRIFENFFPHVRERGFNPGEEKQVEIYRLEGMTPADSSRLERWMDEQLRNPPPYSIRDLFRYAVNLPPVSGRSCFCSQFVLRGLRECLSYEKQPLTRLEYQDFASPRDLRISPRLHLHWQ